MNRTDRALVLRLRHVHLVARHDQVGIAPVVRLARAERIAVEQRPVELRIRRLELRERLAACGGDAPERLARFDRHHAHLWRWRWRWGRRWGRRRCWCWCRRRRCPGRSAAWFLFPVIRRHGRALVL